MNKRLLYFPGALDLKCTLRRFEATELQCGEQTSHCCWVWEVKKLSVLCKRNQGKVGDQFILVLEIKDKDVQKI